jgi:hypothetical protein
MYHTRCLHGTSYRVASGSFQEETYSSGVTTKFEENLDVVIEALEILQVGIPPRVCEKVFLVRKILHLSKTYFRSSKAPLKVSNQ